jgi:hypothetical protein
MGLKVNQLKEIAENIKKEQSLLHDLKREVKEVLNYQIDASVGFDNSCHQVNEVLDLMRAKGDTCEYRFKTSLAKKLLESNSHDAKILAVRLLPKNLITNLRFNKDVVIRLEVCKRLPLKMVSEVSEQFPADFELQHIVETKKGEEEEFLHLYDEKRMGAAAKPAFQSELSDSWYREIAAKFLQDYGTNIEYQWEETLVKRYCESIRNTTGVVVDEKKLYTTLKQLIDEKEDNALLDFEEKKLKKLYKLRENHEEMLESTLKGLLTSSISQQHFVSTFNEIFDVKQSFLPPTIRKYVSSSGMSLPVKATIPNNESAVLIERALDSYVKNWNDQQALRGDPIKISWSYDQMNTNKVSFSAELR